MESLDQTRKAVGPFSQLRTRMCMRFPPCKPNGDWMPNHEVTTAHETLKLSLVFLSVGFNRHGSEPGVDVTASWASVRLTCGLDCQARILSRNWRLRLVKQSANMASVGTHLKFRHVCRKAAMSISTRFSWKLVARRCIESNSDRASVTGQTAKGDLLEWDAIYPKTLSSPSMHPRKLQ